MFWPHLIEKGHRGLSKLCNVIGLAPSLSDVQFMEHVNFLESIASELYLENVKSAKEKANCLVQKEYGVDSRDAIDLPASFDGSWCWHKWTGNRGIVSAIAGVSSQIIDVSYKCRSYAQCSFIEECKKNGKLLTIEYLDAVIGHEPKCFLNHIASPQVRKFFHAFFSEKRNSFPSELCMKSCIFTFLAY